MKKAVRAVSFVIIIYILSTLTVYARGEERDNGQSIYGDDTREVSFVVWGHPRGYKDGVPPLHFEEILERIAELKPDALIVTGDVIWGGVGSKDSVSEEEIIADWERFDIGVSQLGIPVYRVPGNHDANNFKSRDIYYNRYERLPFAVSLENTRLILMDTMGIDQRVTDGPWGAEAIPFDDVQMEFIRKELKKQESYDHLFFFMHHTRPWSAPNGFWRNSVHPLLVGSRTRAVFSGTPWYFKYAHDLRDGIHYIISCTVPLRSKGWFSKYPDDVAVHRQLDNLQYVKIKGDKVDIRTVVVGALSDNAPSYSFWQDLDEPVRWSHRLAKEFRSRFYRFRDLSLLLGGIGVSFFLLGTIMGYMVGRSRRK